MEIVYAAHTQSGVFMLDENGVCRWAVAQPGRTGEKVPERIVGAQYLATVDLEAEGGIVDFPRVGCPMLFAATDETGRVRLVRTPPLMRFEDRRVAPARRPLASKFDDDEKTPVALARSSSVPPPPSSIEAAPLPLTKPLSVTQPIPTTRTPLPPPPRARIAARIPPPPPTGIGGPTSLASTGSGLRVSPTPTPTPSTLGVQSIPVRFHAANMSLKKLARGK